MNYKKIWKILKDKIEQEVEQYGTEKETLAYMKALEEEDVDYPEYHIVRLENGEWEALYKGNKLVSQNHRLELRDIDRYIDDVLVLNMSEEDFERFNLNMPDDFAELIEVL